MTQRFRTLDVLSLEVEDDWPGLPNLVLNPLGGDFGGYGWRGVDAADEGLRVAFVEDDTAYFAIAETDPMPLPTGVPVLDVELAAAAEVLAIVDDPDGSLPGLTVSLDMLYFDAAGTLVGYSGSNNRTTPGPLSVGGSLSIYPTAAWFTVRLYVYVPAAESTPAPSGYFDFTNVVAQAGTTASSVGSSMDVEPDYLEVLHVATSVATDRIPMDVATLTVNLVIDPDGPVRLGPGEPLLPVVDPDKIRKGKQVRLRAIVSDNPEPERRYLFRGWIGDPVTTYDVTSKPRAVARVSFPAVDVISVLAAVNRPNGPRLLEHLIPLVLIGAGVPYDVESSTGPGPGQNTPPLPVAYVQDATALDQVVVTRDTYLAYAWATAAGLLKIRTAFSLGDDLTGTFDEEFYNGGGPTIGYELTDVVNSLTVKFRAGDETTTTETSYGPFEDLDSIREYAGRISKEVTIQGDPSEWLPEDPDDPAQLEASPIGQYARAVLASNSTTQKRITAVTAAVASLEDLAAAGAAHHDLYELVTASSVRGGLEQPSRITRVAHSITPGKWLVTYGLVDVDRVARHQRTRSLR